MIGTAGGDCSSRSDQIYNNSVLINLKSMALLRRHLLHLAWLQATVATAGSLYFSEIMDLPPCSLCWYQRIAMYPLVIILALGIRRRDRSLPAYVLPLSLIGLAITRQATHSSDKKPDDDQQDEGLFRPGCGTAHDGIKDVVVPSRAIDPLLESIIHKFSSS